MTQQKAGSGKATNMSCTFCGIVRGETPANVVFEDEVSIAFLDHRPLFPGHCILIPKAHFQTFVDLPTDLITPLFANAQLLAKGVEQAMEAEGTFVAINNRVSQSVPHFHIHICASPSERWFKGFLLAPAALQGQGRDPRPARASTVHPFATSTAGQERYLRTLTQRPHCH